MPDLQRIQESINSSPFYRTMGFRLVELGPGLSRLEATVMANHMNVYGNAHGGLCAALIDSAIGTAFIGALGHVDHAAPTVELKLNYLAPVTGGKLVATGKLVHRGRTLAVGWSEVRQETGELVAVGSATYMAPRNAVPH